MIEIFELIICRSIIHPRRDNRVIDRILPTKNPIRISIPQTIHGATILKIIRKTRSDLSNPRKTLILQPNKRSPQNLGPRTRILTKIHPPAPFQVAPATHQATQQNKEELREQHGIAEDRERHMDSSKLACGTRSQARADRKWEPRIEKGSRRSRMSWRGRGTERGLGSSCRRWVRGRIGRSRRPEGINSIRGRRGINSRRDSITKGFSPPLMFKCGMKLRSQPINRLLMIKVTRNSIKKVSGEAKKNLGRQIRVQQMIHKDKDKE